MNKTAAVPDREPLAGLVERVIRFPPECLDRGGLLESA
jgi:hypothetical protein